MEQLEQMIKKFIGCQNHSMPLEHLMTKYECDLCKDTEFIIDERNVATFCSCRKAKHYKKLYESAGISKVFQNKTLDTYITEGKPQIINSAKKTAKKYIENFNGTKSIAFIGQVGSGKTHLCFAIASELLKQNIGVLYMQYREVITQLKQCITDEETYKRELNKYRDAPVLYIDDLYKGMLKNGSINDSEIRIMFEIINYRYLNQKPILVSSEYGAEKLLSFDEAVGSRIIEMCKGYIIEFKGMELNYRLNG